VFGDAIPAGFGAKRVEMRGGALDWAGIRLELKVGNLQSCSGFRPGSGGSE
jgi:hypothetical protein